jgi:hypothetical protein
MEFLRMRLPAMIRAFIIAKKTKKKVQHNRAQEVAVRYVALLSNAVFSLFFYS